MKPIGLTVGIATLKRLAALCLVFSVVVAPSTFAQTVKPEIRFRHYGNEQGLSSLILNDFDRDSRGFIWLAATGGLYRFDGYRFQHFTHNPTDENSLSGNRVRSVVVDSMDRVWAGTESNGVTMYDPATNSFRRFGNDPRDPESYFAGQSLVMHELPDGTISILVFGDGMVHISPDLQTVQRFRHDASDPTSLSGNNCLAQSVDLQGRLWVACLGGTLQRFDPANESFVAYSDIFGVETSALLGRITAITFDRKNDLWMGTDGVGLLRHRAGGEGLDHLVAGQEPYNLTQNLVTRLAQTPDGSLWIGYRDSGLDVLDIETMTARHIAHMPGRTSSLSSDNTFGLAAEDNGMVWVPTAGGGLNVTVPANQDVIIYESVGSGPGPFGGNANVWPLLELDDGRLLIDSRDRRTALFERDGDTLVLSQLLDLDPGDDRPFWIIGALQGADGRLWIPTIGRGLYVYDLQADQSSFVAGTEGWNIVSIFQDSRGTIWLSEFARGLLTIDPVTGEMTNAGEFISGVSVADLGPVLDIVETTGGRLWFGTRSGAFRLSPDRRTLTRMSSLAADVGQEQLRSARSMTIDGSGRLWIAGETISYTMAPDAEEPEFTFPLLNTVFEGASSNIVLEDPYGRLWFGTPDTLLAHDPETGVTRVFDESVEAPVNIPDTGGLRLKSGEMLFTGSRQLALVSPSLFDRSTPLPSPEVTRMVLGGVEVYGVSAMREGQPFTGNRTSRIVVTPDTRDFTVEYASLNPIAAHSFSYAHKLEGFDRDWIRTDATRRSATYTNLSPGTYTLQINVFDRSGRSAGVPSSVRIEVLPRFYETLWFQATVAFLAILGLWGIYRARLSVLQANQEKLERQVAERTAKIERQRSELSDRNAKIERTMAELKETQDMLVQSEKLAALGGLVSGVAHEVNTPIGLIVSGASQIDSEVTTIKGKLNDKTITKTDLERFLEIAGDLGRLTLSNAQKAANLIKSFKLVSADQASQQVADIELIDYLRDVLISLKPLLSEKGHTAIIESSDPIYVSMNAGALSQVITNLVSNAVTHGFAQKANGTIRIAARETQDQIVLTVQDDGCGIPEVDQRKVFDPFFTTKRGQGNTGLGLHIVHNLVVGALKGNVELVQPEDGGTKFIINLPRYRAVQ